MYVYIYIDVQSHQLFLICPWHQPLALGGFVARVSNGSASYQSTVLSRVECLHRYFGDQNLKGMDLGGEKLDMFYICYIEYRYYKCILNEFCQNHLLNISII